MSEPWPTELRLISGGRVLAVLLEDGARLELPAELLRVESPSAEVQGHSAAEKRLVPGKAAVRITSVEPVGNYAVRLGFDDGHATGIYSWPYLAELGRDPALRIARYRATLAAAGLSAEPPAVRT